MSKPMSYTIVWDAFGKYVVFVAYLTLLSVTLVSDDSKKKKMNGKQQSWCNFK